MNLDAHEHTLEFLLSFDGRIHFLEEGYRLKFEIKQGERTPERPHGLRYSFTLHDPDGKRLIGFDNAHPVSPPGSRFTRQPVEYDHWHRAEGDKGRLYEFTTAEALLTDFFTEVRRVLGERSISEEVVRVEPTTNRRSQ